MNEGNFYALMNVTSMPEKYQGIFRWFQKFQLCEFFSMVKEIQYKEGEEGE